LMYSSFFCEIDSCLISAILHHSQQVNYREDEDPYNVDEVPVQCCSVHFRCSVDGQTALCVTQHEKRDPDQADTYVETMCTDQEVERTAECTGTERMSEVGIFDEFIDFKRQEPEPEQYCHTKPQLHF